MDSLIINPKGKFGIYLKAMNVSQIKTRKFLPPKDEIKDLLGYVPKLQDGSIVALSSKVISICEGKNYSINVHFS